ncbi:MAG: ABC transporter permease [Gemmataceae bacterium]
MIGTRGSSATLVVAARLVLLSAVLLVWELLARTNVLPRAFIGEPSAILAILWQQLVSGAIPRGAAETLDATLAAFAIGGVAALVTALPLTASRFFRAVLEPFLNALNALPRVALVPLFIVWFGLGTLSKIVSGVSLMYFILLYNTLAGAQSVEPDHLLLARSLGLSARRVFVQIILPTAMPAIFAGLRLGLIYSLLGVVTAELIAGGSGLGSQISYYSNTFNANGVFAILLVLVVIADLLSRLMTSVEHRLTRWQAPRETPATRSIRTVRVRAVSAAKRADTEYPPALKDNPPS